MIRTPIDVRGTKGMPQIVIHRAVLGEMNLKAPRLGLVLDT